MAPTSGQQKKRRFRKGPGAQQNFIWGSGSGSRPLPQVWFQYADMIYRLGF